MDICFELFSKSCLLSRNVTTSLPHFQGMFFGAVSNMPLVDRLGFGNVSLQANLFQDSGLNSIQ